MRSVGCYAAVMAAVAGSILGGAPRVRAGNPLKIMPLGDSITNGNNGYVSYRYPLYYRLQADGYTNYTFVGTQQTTNDDSLIKTTDYPRYNIDFPKANEGHQGYYALTIANQITSWASSTQPDVVLLMAGLNDLIGYASDENGVITSYKSIIANLRAVNPPIVVLVAKLTPAAWYNVNTLNTLIGQQIPQLTTSQSPVMVVDQYTGFDPSTMQVDGVHPNLAGGQFMSDRWAPVLESVLPVAAGQVVTISAALVGAQGPIKSGGGTMKLLGANTYTGIGGTVVNGGTLVFGAPNTRPTGDVLTLGKDTTLTPAGAMVVLNTGETMAQVRAELQAGTIKAAIGAAGVRQGVGYLTTDQYNALHGANFATGGVVAKYTYLGDATLKGYIDAGDYAQLDVAWMKGIYDGKHLDNQNHVIMASWNNGDFDYNGLITANDFAILDAAYTLSHGGTLANDPLYAGHLATFGAGYADLVAAQQGMAAVPEPGTLALLAGGLALALGRKSRRDGGPPPPHPRYERK